MDFAYKNYNAQIGVNYYFCQKGFEAEYKDFKFRFVDLECRLASLLCLVFKDCTELESALNVSKSEW